MRISFGSVAKTIQKHVDNLALGGEIIRDLNETPSLRRKTIEQILDDRIDEEGGPHPIASLNPANHPQIPPDEAYV